MKKKLYTVAISFGLLCAIIYFMGLFNWGSLPKDQTNPQLITEAIAQAIAIHEADPDAHLGDGESLASHRASDIIDHLALSIVADKYSDFSVLKEKLTTNKDYLSTNFESLDFWNILAPSWTYTNFGQMDLYSPNTLNGSSEAFANGDPFSINFLEKNPVFEELVKVSFNTSILAYWGVGDPFATGTDDFMGFKVLNNALYASWFKSGVEHSSAITGIDFTKFHTYRAVMTSGSKIDFYVDDVLLYTATTNIPSGEETLDLWHFYVKQTSSGQRFLSIKACTFYQDR